MHGRRASLPELKDYAEKLRWVTTSVDFLPDLVDRIGAEEQSLATRCQRLPLLLRPPACAMTAVAARRRLRAHVRRALHRSNIDAEAQTRRSNLFKTATGYIDDRLSATRYHIRATARGLKGLRADAIEDYEKAAAIEGGPAIVGVLCWAYARVGKLAEARRTLERLEQMTTKRIVPPPWLALAYDALGADAQARACMERAVEERHMLLVHLSGFMGWVGWLSGYRSLLDQHGL